MMESVTEIAVGCPSPVTQPQERLGKDWPLRFTKNVFVGVLTGSCRLQSLCHGAIRLESIRVECGCVEGQGSSLRDLEGEK